jgi:hypothetical protein
MAVADGPAVGQAEYSRRGKRPEVASLDQETDQETINNILKTRPYWL